MNILAFLEITRAGGATGARVSESEVANMLG